MAPVFTPVIAAAVLLIVAGVGKLRRPVHTVGALKSVGVHVPAVLVRGLGGAEVALGVACIIVGGPVLTALVGLSYFGFAGFLAVALRRGGAMSSCGCLGRPDTPPTRTHVVVTAALGISALVSAVFGGVVPRQLSWTGADATLLALTALATWLAWLIFTVLPHARLRRLEER